MSERLQLQGDRIHTISQSGWFRTVIKQVAQMGATVRTSDLGAAHKARRRVVFSGDLGAAHTMAGIETFINSIVLYSLIEARPAGT